MGNSKWSDDTYSSMSRVSSTKTKAAIFTNTTTDNLMDPKGIKFRESRDSTTHPNTLGIMFWLDETGSMGDIPEILVKKKLGALMSTLIAHGIPDAQVFFGGIGDHYTDRCPLQVGQFESGTVELDQWLTKIFLEGKGGGQNMESYLLAWLFAARHTSIDCYEKRGEKGFLFTAGDEWCHDLLGADYLKKIMGYTEATELTREQLLQEAQRMYHIYHIHVDHDGHHDDTVINHWKKLLNENLIICKDYNAIAEIVATTVAVVHGVDIKSVTSAFDDKTAKLVTNALVNIHQGVAKRDNETGIVAL